MHGRCFSATEKQKIALLDAYARKGIALCRKYLLDKHSNEIADQEHLPSTLDSIMDLWRDILKFFEYSDRVSIID